MMVLVCSFCEPQVTTDIFCHVFYSTTPKSGTREVTVESTTPTHSHPFEVRGLRTGLHVTVTGRGEITGSTHRDVLRESQMSRETTPRRDPPWNVPRRRMTVVTSEGP